MKSGAFLKLIDDYDDYTVPWSLFNFHNQAQVKKPLAPRERPAPEIKAQDQRGPYTGRSANLFQGGEFKMKTVLPHPLPKKLMIMRMRVMRKMATWKRAQEKND